MEVEYVLTVEDHIAFNRYQQASNRLARPNMRWLWLILLALILAVYSLSSAPRDPEQAPPPQVSAWEMALRFAPLTIPLVLVVVFLVWGRTYLLTVQVKRLVTHPDNRRRLLGWRRISLGLEGLAVRGEDINVTLAWTAIGRFAVTKDHAFLYLTTMEAVIVPRRPFASDEAFREFIETARDYRDRAQGAPPERRPARNKDAGEPDTNIAPDERTGR